MLRSVRRKSMTKNCYFGMVLLVLIALGFVAILPEIAHGVTELGVGQRILAVSQSAFCTNLGAYNFPSVLAASMNLPCDVIYMDLQRLPNSTLYDAQGNGKYCMIFMNYYGFVLLSSTEIGYIDYYERTFNITEASNISVFSSSAFNSRYGITSYGNVTAVGNVTWAQGNVRMEYTEKGIGNYTEVRPTTLAAGAHVYAYAGNETQNIPFLWSYTEGYGVTKTACSQVDAGLLFAPDWQLLPTILALNLDTNNVLWTYTFGYDVDDINMNDFGPAWNTTDTENIIRFYSDYSLPFTLCTQEITNYWNRTGWGPVYDIIKQHPDIFPTVDHSELETQPLSNIGRDWNTFNSLGLYPNYWYMVPTRHKLNASIAQYLYDNLLVNMVRQTVDIETGQTRSAWYPPYNKTWAPFGYGTTAPVHNWDNFSSYDWTTDTYYYSYESWLHNKYLDAVFNMKTHCGFASIMWDHYPELRNEQPLLKALKDTLFDLGLYKLVPTFSAYAALASRTFEGSYNITNPIYYPANQTLTFSLTSLGTAPDDICGIVLPTTKAKMDDQIFYAPGHAGSKCNSGAFLEFKYVAGKTYTIYIGQEEKTKPYVTTQNYNSQLWLTGSKYSNCQLNITFQPPQAPNLKSMVEVYTGNLGEPLNISGATGIFNSISGIETLTATNTPVTSDQASYNPIETIVLNWEIKPTPTPSPETTTTPLPSNSPNPSYSPSFTPTPTPTATSGSATPEFMGTAYFKISFLLIALFSITAIAYAMKQRNSKKTTPDH